MKLRDFQGFPPGDGQFYPPDIIITAKNISGAALGIRTGVKLWTANNGALVMDKASHSSETRDLVAGVLIDYTEDQQFGRVMLQGILTGIDTSDLSAGSDVVLSTTPGVLSNTGALAGAGWYQYIAICLTSHKTSGSLFVRAEKLIRPDQLYSSLKFGTNGATARLDGYANNHVGSIRVPAITADRIWNFQDVDGTIALTDLTYSGYCQGRLTLTTATPVTTADVTGTTIYFTPYAGNKISLYDGTNWNVYTLTELSKAIPATTLTVYDVFVYLNAGVLDIELVSWASDTARTTAIVLQDGVYCKSGSLGRRYVGTIRTGGTSATAEDTAIRRFVWNYYNRVTKYLYAHDTTDSWNYATASFRAANNTTATGTARVELLIGVAEVLIEGLYFDVGITSNSIGGVGIGLDSTTVNSGLTWGGATINIGRTTGEAIYKGFPAIGAHYVQSLEIGNTGCTFYGDNNAAYLQSGLIVTGQF
jgi:hypothetical protein